MKDPRWNEYLDSNQIKKGEKMKIPLQLLLNSPQNTKPKNLESLLSFKVIFKSADGQSFLLKDNFEIQLKIVDARLTYEQFIAGYPQ